MKKPAIPSPAKGPNERFDRSVKESLEIITGARGVRIKKLNADAGLSDVIEKLNEMLTLLQ